MTGSSAAAASNHKKAKGVLHSKRAGIFFPVGSVKRILNKGHGSVRCGVPAAAAATAVLEFEVSEMIRAGAAAARRGPINKDANEYEISKNTFTLALLHDKGVLRAMCAGFATVNPDHIRPMDELLLEKKPKKEKKASKKNEDAEAE
jgi:hypothetical protein